MKSLVMIVLVAVTMFGLAAGASWVWQKAETTGKSADAGEQTAQNSAHDAHGSHDSKKTPPSRGTDVQRPTTDAAAKPEHEPPTRVTVQPTYTPGIEETVQLASSLRERAALAREHENQLLARQKQLELVIEDIRAERAGIDELRSQLDEALKAGEEHMADVQRHRTELEIKQQNIDGRVTEMAGHEKDNIKKMGTVYDSMPPEKAAKIIQQMADGDTMDTAVKLLAVMKERQAAKVLAEMSDPSLGAQLSEKLKDLKHPAAPAKKK